MLHHNIEAIPASIYSALRHGIIIKRRLFAMNELSEHVRRNRAHWDRLASNYVSAGEHYRLLYNIVTYDFWSDGVLVIPARVSGAREESQKWCLAGRKDWDSSRNGHARE